MPTPSNVSSPHNDTNGTCVNWCRWVPYASWPYTPSCHGCFGSVHGPAPPTPAPGAGCASWCQYVPGPSQSYTPECGGCSPPSSPAAPAGCASWCGWVPETSHQYTPECRGCVQGASGSEAPQGSGSVSGTTACASWCEHVPSSAWQYSSGCKRLLFQDPAPCVKLSGCMSAFESIDLLFSKCFHFHGQHDAGL